MQTALGQTLPDPATGLLHLGGGRFYNPSTGRPLQPNPAGGVPTVPQSLNRYAATVLGQVGVAVATANSNSLLAWAGDNWYKQAIGVSANLGLAQSAELKVTASVLQVSYSFKAGQQVRTVSGAYRSVGRNLWQAIDDPNAIYKTKDFMLGAFLASDIKTRWTKAKVDNRLKAILNTDYKKVPVGRIGMNVGLATLLNVGFEGYEFATGTGRWGNPYWTGYQKVNQSLIGIGGDLLIVTAIAWWNPGFWTGIGVYFVASVGWNYIHPVIFADDFVEHRNLKPLP